MYRWDRLKDPRGGIISAEGEGEEELEGQLFSSVIKGDISESSARGISG